MSSSKLVSLSAILNEVLRIHIRSTLDITVICIEGLYFICAYGERVGHGTCHLMQGSHSKWHLMHVHTTYKCLEWVFSGVGPFRLVSDGCDFVGSLFQVLLGDGRVSLNACLKIKSLRNDLSKS